MKKIFCLILLVASCLSVEAQYQPRGGGGLTSGTVTTPDTNANNVVAPTATTKKPLVIQLAPSQSANGFEVQDSAGSILFSISPAGVITSANGTLLNAMTDTWNNGGTTFDGISLDVTNTASAADSRLLQLKIGGVPIHRFRIDKSYQIFNTSTSDTNYERGGMFWAANVFKVGTEKGAGGGTARDTYIITPQRQWTFSDASGSFASAGAVIISASQYLGWVGKSHIYGGFSDGVISMFNSGENGFNRLTGGDTTSSYPAFKRVGADWQVTHGGTTAATNVEAADSEMQFIEDRYRRKGSGSPESVITAPIGAIYHRTDGGAGTSIYVKESGTGNTGWVAK